jgi:predicted SnoaL-like aldol condensation-catalyzing enzyme
MKYIVLVLSLMFFVTSCKKEDTPGTTASNTEDSVEQANKAKFEEVYKIFASDDLAGIENHIAADFVEHTPWPGQEPGLEGLKKGFMQFKAAFPDLKITLNDVWTDGDIAIGHFTQTGTMTGPLGPMPATNKKMEIHGVDIVRIKDGKAVEHWGYQEDNKMAQQMGWAPPMDAGPAPSGGTGGGTPKSDAPKGTPKSPAPEGKPKY